MSLGRIEDLPYLHPDSPEWASSGPNAEVWYRLDGKKHVVKHWRGRRWMLTEVTKDRRVLHYFPRKLEEAFRLAKEIVIREDLQMQRIRERMDFQEVRKSIGKIA